MSYDWKIRVTLPYQDCSGIILSWFDRCKTAVCYEHEADDEVKQTHVHLGLFGCEVKDEALKRMWPQAPGKGNAFWSFTLSTEPEKYVTYMSKGKLQPKVVKKFSHEELERLRQLWVDPVKDDKRQDSSEYYINKVLSKISISYARSLLDLHTGEESLLHEVRSETMKVYWGETRRVPHATQYKIVAATAYLRLMEKLDRFEEGIGHVKNLWY